MRAFISSTTSRATRSADTYVRPELTGQHLKEATITHRKAGKGQQEYLIVKMNDVLITGVVHGGAAGSPASESVSLVFAKVDLEYKAQKADGSLEAGIHFKYDLKANKEG